MAGKARVHELAKELGVTSKEVLARLSEQGEFVKSASSTVEAPVARRLRESFGGRQANLGEGRRARKPQADAGVQAGGNGSATVAPVRSAGDGATAAAPAAPAAPAETPQHRPAAPVVKATPEPARRPHRCPVLRRRRPPTTPRVPAPARCPGVPARRPSGGAQTGRAPPRVGNNPFSSAQPVDRPIPRPHPRPVPARRGPERPVRAPRPATCRPARRCGDKAVHRVPVAAPARRRPARWPRWRSFRWWRR